MGKVLIVEDDADCLEAIAETLQGLGLHVAQAASGTRALELWDDDPALDQALCDLSLPDMNGASLAAELRRRRPGARIALLTGYERFQIASEEEAAIDRWFRKPIDPDAIGAFLASRDNAPSWQHR